ncbi:MAG TPA: hypothetical protein V6D10_11460 [Trichocoleus sp.]|jgi:hypothetical protein
MGIVRLSDWQFDPREKVTLWWLRSPWRESIHRQWRITAVFKRESGEFKEVDFPWGLLPWLKLGQIFQDGQPIWNEAVGDNFELKIGNASTATLSTSANIPTLANYLLQGRNNLAEYCFKLQTQKQVTIVIPVLECIRAFLVPNKSLAFGLLEPNYFERIVTRNEITGLKLLLDFSEDVPKKILSRPLVFRIARLLYDSSFRAAWDRVFRDRLSQTAQTNWNASIPLVTSLPNFSSTWHVRGMLTGQVLLVQQIMEVSPSQSLPFTELEFTHPRIKKREYVEQQSAKQQRRPKKETKHIIESEAEPPDVPNAPKSLPKLGSSIIEKQKVKLKKTGTISILFIKQVTDTEDAENYNTERLLKSQAVNLSDKGRSGRTPAAEFTQRLPLDIFVALDDGLDEFGEAIRFLNEMHWDVTTTWDVREFNQETLFTKVAERPRKYALVTLQWQGKYPCWILEFGRPDSFSISTLIFTFALGDSNETLESVLDKILTQGLQPGGGWSSKPLEKLKESIRGFNYRWAKHTNSFTEEWGERLYKNAQGLIG